MMISVSTNGSRLWAPKILTLLTTRRPYRITVSVYGATAAAYEAVTVRRGSFRAFTRGLAAAVEAGLNLHLNVIVVKQNAHEADAMGALADRFGVPCKHLHQHVADDLRWRRTAARPVGRAPAQTQGVHRLQRRSHLFPRRPARQCLHLQGRAR
jgi:MoaA/NifB/PqqE/SkfB family radical SAM enzyme